MFPMLLEHNVCK